MEKEIQIKRVSFGLTIDGVRYAVKKPNLNLLKEFTAKQKQIENEKGEAAEVNSIDHSILFLSRLGIPSEIVEDLDPEMLEDIIKIVTGQKKS